MIPLTAPLCLAPVRRVPTHVVAYPPMRLSGSSAIMDQLPPTPSITAERWTEFHMDKKPLLLIGAFLAVVVVTVLIVLAIEVSSHSGDPIGASSALSSLIGRSHMFFSSLDVAP